MAGRQAIGSRALGEREQLGEAEAAVAARARIRSLAAGVAANERSDDRAAELLAQIERHMRHAESMARLARRDHALGRAAGALGIRAGRIEPEAKSHAHRVRQRAEQRDGTVDAAAHRNSHASGRRLGAEDRPERVRERVDGERLASDRRCLEKRQSSEVAVESWCVRLDNPIAVDAQPDGRPLAGAARVSEDLLHGAHRR